MLLCFSRTARQRLTGFAALWLALGSLLLSLPLQAQNILNAPGASPALSVAVGSVVKTEQVQAELIAHAPDGVGPGKTVWAGLRIQHQPGWHTYWKNPGDSGLPTQLQWTLPAGVKASDIAWPAPQRIRIGSLANFGYGDVVLLPVVLTIGPDFKPVGGVLDLRVNASWLVCREECVPQDGSFALQIPVKGSMALHSALFDASFNAAPKPHQGSAQARLEGQTLVLAMQGLPETWRGKSLNVYPETPEIADSPRTPSAQDASGPAPARTGTQAWGGAPAYEWTAVIPLSTMRTEAPASMAFVLALAGKSLRTETPVVGTWPTVQSPSIPAAAPSTAPSGAPPVSLDSGLGGIAFALAAAFLGGLILNLMPCVLPVLAIKVLSFSTPGKAAASHRMEGLAYTGGVVVSFLALGGLVLALRSAGEQLGWGFQLQSPAVVSALALLFTLIGLNLMGLLELGHMLPSSLASMQLRHPVADAFLSGVLAVAVASPCTAPFMGASLGYAMTLPAVQAMAIFGAIGLGLALPYLAASWIPGVTRWLPRPGVWMDTFKRFMAFPMWATVIWLVWVLGHLNGMDAAASLLALLLATALLVWSLGLPGRSRHLLGGTALIVLVALAGSMGRSVVSLAEGADSANATDPASSLPGGSAAAWQPWSPAAVEQALASGKPVFVDYTAAWCITCQLNKKTTLSDPQVLAGFAARGVVLMRADWTRRDPVISRSLNALGRSGVPVYVLHKPGGAPLVLSEVLSTGDVRAALSTL